MTDVKIVTRKQEIGNAISIQGAPIDSAEPTNDQGLVYNATERKWDIAPIPGSDKVSRSGDTMTGDLNFTAAPIRQVGCNDLGAGETFRLLMGEDGTNIEITDTNMIITGRSGIRLGFGALDPLCQLTATGLEVQNADVNITTRVINAADPTDPQDAATKNYVDSINARVSITAASQGDITTDEFNFSFGDSEGTGGTNQLGWVAPKPGSIIDMSLAGSNNVGGTIGEVTVGLAINGVEQDSQYRITKGAGVFGATQAFATPLPFSTGDRINFISKTTLVGNQSIIVSFLGRI